MPNVRFVRWVFAGLLLGFATVANAAFHLWRVSELYSNADGTIQFIEFREIAGANGEHFLADHSMTSRSGMQVRRFTFQENLPSAATANRRFLVATQAFANLGVVAPDYIMPAGFLFVAGGTLDYGGVDVGPYPMEPADSVAYAALPTDGTTSVDRDGMRGVNSPTNFAGATGTIGAAAASPQTGWWWNAAENGRGFFIEQQGSSLFFAAYLYADNGRALWTISAGPMASSSSYQGTLLTFAGGQTLTGPYVAPTAGSPLGALTLSFTDATHGTLTWPGGTIPIERFDYAGLAAPPIASAPETGWWWNAAESGRGFSLEVQGSTVFIAGYLYDAAGNPVWYTSADTLNAAGAYQGTWMQFANGQALGAPYRPPQVVNANAGALALQFNDRQNGTLTLPDNRMIPITRFRF